MHHDECSDRGERHPKSVMETAEYVGVVSSMNIRDQALGDE